MEEPRPVSDMSKKELDDQELEQELSRSESLLQQDTDMDVIAEGDEERATEYDENGGGDFVPAATPKDGASEHKRNEHMPGGVAGARMMRRSGTGGSRGVRALSGPSEISTLTPSDGSQDIVAGSGAADMRGADSGGQKEDGAANALDPLRFLRYHVYFLCIAVFLFEFKPSEPYLVEYLTCDDDDDDERCYKHFSEDEVNDYILPVSTYAWLPLLIVLCLVAHFWSYRVAILLGYSGRVLTRLLLLYSTELWEMLIMQVTYAMGSAAFDVLNAYLFVFLPLPMYQSAEALFHSTLLIAEMTSGLLGDLLVEVGGVNLYVLMYISAGFVLVGWIWSFFVVRPVPNQHGASNASVLVADMERRNMNSSDKENLGKSAIGIIDSDANNLRAGLLRHDHAVMNAVLGNGSGGGGDGGAGANTDAGAAEGNQAAPQDAEQQEEQAPRPRQRDKYGRPLPEQPSPAMLAGTVVPSRDDVWADILAAFPQLSNALFSVWFILGNGLFAITYNYETSIFYHLNGSDAWNGSVFGAILLFGAICSLAFAHPFLERWHSKATFVRSMVTCATLASVGGVALVISAASHSVVPTMLFFALHFGAWQGIDVCFYTFLARQTRTRGDEDEVDDEVIVVGLDSVEGSGEEGEDGADIRRFRCSATTNSSISTFKTEHTSWFSRYSQRLPPPPPLVPSDVDVPEQEGPRAWLPPFALLIMMHRGGSLVVSIFFSAVFFTGLQFSLWTIFSLVAGLQVLLAGALWLLIVKKGLDSCFGMAETQRPAATSQSVGAGRSHQRNAS